MSQGLKRKILVTGGAGFIGLHLCQRLARDPDNQVVLADNFIRGRLDPDLERLAECANVRLVTGDLTQRAVFEEIGQGYDEVYHLAAIIGVRNVLSRPHEVLRVNCLAVLNLLEWFAAGGGRRLLFASTSEAYAWTLQFYDLPIPTPEDVPLSITDCREPRASYAGSKILGEMMVSQYGAAYRKPYIIVRYHNVYGPRMGNQHVIPELYQRAAGGENPLTVFSADHTRAFCYVSDTVAATILAMRTDAACGLTINIGNDEEEIAIAKLAARLLSVSGIDAVIRPGISRHDPITRRCPDISLARRILGYRPQVNLDEGLARTLAWYARQTSRPASGEAL
jgi:UDP-glucose 4-epimerase/UDP-glucuronate decarboxylase